MDLEALSKEGKVPLLTLAWNDLAGKEKHRSKPTTAAKATSDSQLLMMQLPPSLTMEDLAKSSSSYFVGNQQASLIVDGQSFDVNRVETSNALVLVPPNEEPPHKKVKLNDNKSLVSLSAQLLTPGGSGASFLELIPKPSCVNLHDLYQLLQPHVLDPDNDGCSGISVESLAHTLQTSIPQIQAGLDQLDDALLLPKSSSFALLSEEVLLETQMALTSALTECEVDYASKCISISDTTDQVLARLDQDSDQALWKHIVQHVVRAFQTNRSSTDDDCLRLNVEKVSDLLSVYSLRRLLYLLSLCCLDCYLCRSTFVGKQDGAMGRTSHAQSVAARDSRRR